VNFFTSQLLVLKAFLFIMVLGSVTTRLKFLCALKIVILQHLLRVKQLVTKFASKFEDGLCGIEF